MPAEKFITQLHSPTPAEFAQLRAKIGWGEIDLTLAQTSLDNSLFHVVIREHTKLIAMGRIVGDGAMYFYIQDVIVDPQYQGLGLGTAIMEKIEAYLSVKATSGATIGLLAAKGKEPFYQRFNYIERPSESLGNGMCKFV